jgi:DNA-binding response OmpR family regulator
LLAPPPHSRATILIVEDDLDIREALSQILEDEGYAVLCASNGMEALTLLRADRPPPNLILLDLMMPVMNGWQFRTEQKADAALSRIPVVVISADGNVSDKASTIDAAGYLRKPIHIENLLDELQRHLNGASASLTPAT